MCCQVWGGLQSCKDTSVGCGEGGSGDSVCVCRSLQHRKCSRVSSFKVITQFGIVLPGFSAGGVGGGQ